MGRISVGLVVVVFAFGMAELPSVAADASVATAKSSCAKKTGKAKKKCKAKKAAALAAATSTRATTTTPTTTTTTTTAPPTTTRAPVTAAPTAAPIAPPTTQAPGAACDSNYAGACVPVFPPDVNCPDIPVKNFQRIGSDPHRLDTDNDGVACES